MIRTCLLSLLSFLVLWTSAFPVAAQNPAPRPAPQTEGQDDDPDEPLITVGTQLLELDTVVLDRQGKAVDNLKKEDFELLEDGKPQEIAFFSLVRNGVAVGKTPTPTEPGAKPSEKELETPVEPRYFAVLVDDLHISVPNMVYLKKALTELVEKKITEGDNLLIVTTSGALGFLQQMTDDKRVMRAAVQKLAPRNRQQGPLPGQARITPYQAQLIIRNDPDALQLGIQRYIRENPGITPDMARSQVESIARQVAQETENSTQITIETMRTAMRALTGYRGRKSLFLASDGFLTDDFNGNGRDQVTRTIDSATRAGVTVYSISTAGLETVGMDAGNSGMIDNPIIANRIESQGLTAKLDAMREISGRTGGIIVNNTNDIFGAFQKSLSDNDIYYVLAYYPDKKPDGKFHKIQIRMRTGNYVVRGRTGYLSPDEKAIQRAAEKKSKKDAKLTPEEIERRELKAAIGALAAPVDIPVKLASFFAGNDADTAFSLALDLKSIRFRDVEGKKVNNLLSAFVIVDMEGKTITAIEDRITLNFTPERFALVSKSWFSQVKGQALKPGLYNVRFAVYDHVSGLRGGVSKWIEIPDLTKPGMGISDILFLRETTPSGGTTTGSKPETTAIPGLPPGYVPVNQALRRYGLKEKFAFMVRVFNVPVQQPAPAKSNLGIQVQIYRGKKLMLASPVRRTQSIPAASAPYTYASEFPLDGLTPGKYLLKVVAYETGTKATAVSQNDFFIE